MKKILILLFVLPFFAKAQVPALSLDTTYKAKANQTGVLLVTDAAYFTKLANADSTLFAQFDLYGKLIFRKVIIIDTAAMLLAYRNAINLKVNISDTSAMLAAYRASINSKVNISDTANMLLNYLKTATANAIYATISGLALKVNISDTSAMLLAYRNAINTKQPLGSYLTANQAITVTATGDATGTSSTSGTAPSLPLVLSTVNANVGTFTNPSVTVNAKGLVTGIASGVNTIYQVTAVPFANASGILTSDSTKLSYGGEYVNIATVSAAGISGVLMNQGRAEINGQFGGMFFNIGSGKAAGGTYDASKAYTFQNRGNTYLTMNTTAITGGVNNAAFSANITSTGNITSSLPMKAGGYTVATLPTGVLGQFTYVTDATAPTYLGALTGGGTVKCPVFFNGTIWVSN